MNKKRGRKKSIKNQPLPLEEEKVTQANNEGYLKVTPVKNDVLEVSKYSKSCKPAVWLYLTFSNGTIYRIGAERIAEMKVKKELLMITGDVPEDKRKEMYNEAVKEMLYYPYLLIQWMTLNLKWEDVMLFAIQTYSSKIVSPAEEFKSCKKGVLYEGDEI